MVHIRNITSEFRNANGTNVSINTVRGRLHDIGFSSRIPARKPFISEKNRLKRLAFFHKYKNWGADEWHNVIWSDECRFKLFHSDGRVRVWRQQKERFINECIRTTVKWGGGSVMVWACFFGDTLGPCYLITNTMNSSSYITNILKPFHSTFCLNILENHPKLVFQQDNAPPHVSGRTRSWFAKKNLKLFQWPAQSPDLSPIENIWDVIQRQINNRKELPSNLQELKSAVLEEWREILKEILLSLVKGMPKRLSALGKVKGLQTRY